MKSLARWSFWIQCILSPQGSLRWLVCGVSEEREHSSVGDVVLAALVGACSLLCSQKRPCAAIYLASFFAVEQRGAKVQKQRAHSNNKRRSTQQAVVWVANSNETRFTMQ